MARLHGLVNHDLVHAVQANAQTAIATEGMANRQTARVLREPALFILAMILMFSFSLFPRGYMPARTASGGFTITLCSASGLAQKAMDVPVKPVRHVGSEKCDLVGAAAILPPPVLLQTAPMVPIAMSLWTLRAFALRFASAFDPNAPPTAPPLPSL